MQPLRASQQKFSARIANYMSKTPSQSFDQLMSKERAAKHYIRVTTRQLTSMSIFGVNLLVEYTNLQIQRETEFSRKFSFKSIFSKTQRADILEFRFSIQFFLRVSFVLLQTEL